jgi:hypothetical protein
MKATFISKTDPKYNFGQTLEILDQYSPNLKGEVFYEVLFDGETKPVDVGNWKVLPYDCYYVYPLYHQLKERCEKIDSERKLEDVI